MARNIKVKDQVLLWGYAGGKCSICRNDLLKEFPKSGNIKLGEMAHIIPHSKNGPRGDGVTEGDNTYENLILLCGYHHTMVDNAADDYPRDKLLDIKKLHEKHVSESIQGNAARLSLSEFMKRLPKEAEPKIVPLLFSSAGSHRSYGRYVPKFIQKLLGGSYGYHSVGIELNNLGNAQAEKVTLEISPATSTMPENFFFSADDHITRNTTVRSFEKKLSCGPINAGERNSDAFYFYLNYRGDKQNKFSTEEIAEIEFEYYLTCDGVEPGSGRMKILNA